MTTTGLRTVTVVWLVSTLMILICYMSKSLCPPEPHTCVCVLTVSLQIYSLCSDNQLHSSGGFSTRCRSVAVGICWNRFESLSSCELQDTEKHVWVWGSGLLIRLNTQCVSRTLINVWMILMFSLRVDHLYTFFVQWSPDIYTEHYREHSFLLLDKKKLAEIDNLLRDPNPQHWNVRILILFSFYYWNLPVCTSFLSWGKIGTLNIKSRGKAWSIL